MSGWLERQRDVWVDYVAHAVTEPTGDFPHWPVMQLAHATFSTSVAWTWHDRMRPAGGASSHTLAGAPHIVPTRRHPGSSDARHQLTIPVVFGSQGHCSLVLCTGRHGLTDRHLELARQVQPLLVLLHRQTDLLRGSTQPRSVAHDHGLTCRETAVLSLLAEGRTAESIGRQLGCSPRTVHKHLEHVYRKLGVVDRLGAVRLVDAYAAPFRPAPA